MPGIAQRLLVHFEGTRVVAFAAHEAQQGKKTTEGWRVIDLVGFLYGILGAPALRRRAKLRIGNANHPTVSPLLTERGSTCQMRSRRGNTSANCRGVKSGEAASRSTRRRVRC